MTPASSILTEIISDGRTKYIQNEDEIAVINSAL
jgi:2-oxoglutarate ferredoxin oxidoreductase subunit alpha